MTSLKTSIKTITYLSDIGCLEIQGASLLVDAFVKKVISGPYEEYGKWWIDVEYISWGVPGKTRLMFESKEQALEVKEGYKFLT
ncbi:hypothetical protein WP16_21350 [Salmonella enterica subsp. enterica serovar Hadar]|nr:hypothetical protein [Salmonella enterica subsp. enterica serovar Hadar]